jgi:Icc protein
MIDEVRQANISQFATPAVSYQIIRHSDPLRVDTDAFGYRIVEIDDAWIRTEVVMLTSA